MLECLGSLLICELLQGLAGEESDHLTHHGSADQPTGKFVRNSRVNTSRGQSRSTFITKYVKFNSFPTKYLLASVFS